MEAKPAHSPRRDPTSGTYYSAKAQVGSGPATRVDDSGGQSTPSFV